MFTHSFSCLQTNVFIECIKYEINMLTNKIINKMNTIIRINIISLFMINYDLHVKCMTILWFAMNDAEYHHIIYLDYL